MKKDLMVLQTQQAFSKTNDMNKLSVMLKVLIRLLSSLSISHRGKSFSFKTYKWIVLFYSSSVSFITTITTTCYECIFKNFLQIHSKVSIILLNNRKKD